MNTKISRRLQLKLPACYELALSSDGKLIASVGRNVVISDIQKLERLSSSHPLSHPSSACFNSNGTRLAIKSTSGRIVVIDTTTTNIIHDFKNQKEGEGSQVLFSPCDNFLVDGSWNGYIRVRDSLQNEIKNSFFFKDEMICHASCSEDGNLWVFVHQPKTKPDENFSEPSYLTLWTWPLSSPIKVIRPELWRVDNAVISPDGLFIAIRGYLHTPSESVLQILRLDECKVVDSVTTKNGGTGYAIRWSPDGKLIGSIQEKKIVIHQSEDLDKQEYIGMEYPSDIAFSKDNSFIAYASWNGGLIKRQD